MLLASVPENSSGSCSTTLICSRSDASVQVAHVEAVEQHAPALRVVEARQQAQQRALAGAGRPDDRDPRPGWRVEDDVLKRAPAAGVAEADALEGDVPGARPSVRRRPGARAISGSRVEQVRARRAG